MIKNVTRLLVLLAINQLTMGSSNATIGMSRDQLDVVYGEEKGKEVVHNPEAIMLTYFTHPDGLLSQNNALIQIKAEVVNEVCDSIGYSKWDRSDAGKRIDLTSEEITRYLKACSTQAGSKGSWEERDSKHWIFAEGSVQTFDCKIKFTAYFPENNLLIIKTFHEPPTTKPVETSPPDNHREARTLAGWKIYFTKDAKISSMIDEYGKPNTIDTGNGKTTYLWYNALDYGANKAGILRVRVTSYQNELIVISIYDGYNDLTASMPWAQKVLGTDFGVPND